MTRVSKLLFGLGLGLVLGTLLSTAASWWLVVQAYEWLNPKVARGSWMILIPTVPIVPFAGAAAGTALGLWRWRHFGRVGSRRRSSAGFAAG